MAIQQLSYVSHSNSSEECTSIYTHVDVLIDKRMIVRTKRAHCNLKTSASNHGLDARCFLV